MTVHVRRSRLIRGVLFAALCACAPLTASAHVKWFEPAQRHPLRLDLVLSGRTALAVGVAALAVVALFFLQRLLDDHYWPRLQLFDRMAIGAPTLLAVQAAVTLIASGAHVDLFAPDLPLPRTVLGFGLVAMEIAIAFSLITGLGDWIGGVALILLGPIAFFLFPMIDVLDQLYWAGIGVFVLVIGRTAVEAGKARPWFRRLDRASGMQAVAALRVIVGLAIIAPGLSEKVWNPALGTAFLADNPSFNFMRAIGMSWFTDERFVLAAGATEVVVGVLLVSGLLTRVVIIGMWLPFNLGVPFLPPQELIGHLPIFGIMYVLLVHGPGLGPREWIGRWLLAERAEDPSSSVASVTRKEHAARLF